MRRRLAAALLASTGPRNHAANCPPRRRSDPSSPSYRANSQAGLDGACCGIRCYAMLRTTERQPAFLWPGRLVTGLRGSVLGRGQGEEGVLDDSSDARSNIRCPGNPAVSGQSCCCLQWMSIAWTSGSILCACVPLRRAARERAADTHKTDTAVVGEVRGAYWGSGCRVWARPGEKRYAAR